MGGSIVPGHHVSIAPQLAKRLRRAAAFVAIVWAIAATFVVFQVIALSGTDFALSRPDLFGDLLLPRTVSESTICERPDRAQTTSSARAEAFALGIVVGRAAIVSQFSAPDPQTGAALAVENLARALEVPSPGPFVPVQLANANREFVDWIEADGSRTARQLAERYSSQTCHSYKLGGVWGYSEMVRMALPAERAVFGVEIRHYARQAGVPEQLWRPMLEPMSASAGSVELDASISALTTGILAFLSDAQ